VAGIPSFQLDRLQAVMNAAARLVFQSSRYDYITPLLHRPPALASCAGANFIICSPSWFSSALMDLRRSTWLIPYSQSPEVQVDNDITSALAVPLTVTRLATVGDRAFPVAAVRTWNSLPAEVTSSNSLQTFKSKLRSHLFSASFP